MFLASKLIHPLSLVTMQICQRDHSLCQTHWWQSLILPLNYMPSFPPLMVFSLSILPWSQLIGCLVYLIVTSPDTSHVIHVVSQIFCASHSTHWAALLRIFRYVCGTLFQCLWLSSASSLTLRTYADWDGDVTNCKSTSVFCLFLGDSYLLEKQETVCLV